MFENYPITNKTMSHNTFNKFKTFIEGHIGICIPESKKIMVESRLLKRLKALDHNTYEEYSKYFFSLNGQRDEIPRFIECITTNKTDFFREVNHFNYLTAKVLPEIIKLDNLKEIRLWSAASSTGEEAYTLAMFTEEFLVKYPGMNYKIMATDISEKVLNIGKEGIYPLGNGEPIPMNFKKKYCLLSKDSENPTLRIKNSLRARVFFRHMNLTSESYMVKKLYHVIFLRNVMIYFNKETQTNILNNLYEHLHPNGYLFLGHSENLPDNSIPFERVSPSIYVKKDK